MINIEAPQLIIICIYSIGVGIHLVKNGEPKEGSYSFFANLIATAISVGILW